MPLTRLASDLQYCTEYLALRGGQDPQLEAFLGQMMVVRMAGVFEDHIESQVSFRVARANDPRLSSFVARLMEKRFRNPDWSNICALLKEIGEDLLKDVKSGTTPEERDALDSIVTNKNSLGHEGSSAVTLRDVLLWGPSAERVVRLAAAKIATSSSTVP